MSLFWLLREVAWKICVLLTSVLASSNRLFPTLQSTDPRHKLYHMQCLFVTGNYKLRWPTHWCSWRAIKRIRSDFSFHTKSAESSPCWRWQIQERRRVGGFCWGAFWLNKLTRLPKRHHAIHQLTLPEIHEWRKNGKWKSLKPHWTAVTSRDGTRHAQLFWDHIWMSVHLNPNTPCAGGNLYPSSCMSDCHPRTINFLTMT
jgi:hypothetical protein